MGGGAEGVISRWVEELRELYQDAHKAMCRIGCEENENRYKNLKRKSKIMVSKVIRENTEGGVQS